MKYKDLPIEIQTKIKERIEEQGNILNEDSYKSDRCFGGFTWRETPEGQNFWNKVLNEKNYDVFYGSYPKEVTFDKPFREDDVVKCINNSFNSYTKVIGKHFQLRKVDAQKLNAGRVTSLVSHPSCTINEFHINYSSSDLVIVARTEIKLSKQTEEMENKSDFEANNSYIDEKLGTEYLVIKGTLRGTIVKLKRHDKSSAPLFSYMDPDEEEDSSFISWTYLKRHFPNISETTQTSDFLEHKVYPNEKEGTKYLVISNKWKGLIVKLLHNDGSPMPRFKNEEDSAWLYWSNLKRIEPIQLEESKESSLTVRYRIKTFEEFGNKKPEYWAPSDDMDHLYGYELTKTDIENYFRRKNIKEDFQVDDSWWINCKDIVKIETNLILNTHNEKSTNISSTFVSRIPYAITPGSAPRGIAIFSTREKIRVGDFDC